MAPQRIAAEPQSGSSLRNGEMIFFGEVENLISRPAGILLDEMQWRMVENHIEDGMPFALGHAFGHAFGSGFRARFFGFHQAFLLASQFKHHVVTLL